jgi:two-component system cell cycle response regulator DivK
MLADLPDAEICTVLVAENDDRIRAAVANVLEGDGFATLRAANVPEALAMLSAYRTDYLLLDLSLLTGMDVDLRRLTGNDLRYSTVPIIAMGGYPGARAPSGAAGLLQRPFSLDAFLRVIDTQASRGEMA